MRVNARADGQCIGNGKRPKRDTAHGKKVSAFLKNREIGDPQEKDERANLTGRSR